MDIESLIALIMINVDAIMDKTDREENALQSLYRHPILTVFIEYPMNTIKGKIKALSIMLNRITPYIENMSDEELEDELSKLEDMYLESIGFNRKPNCI